MRGLHDIPAFPVAAVDTNGAGDAFHGAFALALAERRGLDECLRMAIGGGGAQMHPPRHPGRGCPTAPRSNDSWPRSNGR